MAKTATITDPDTKPLPRVAAFGIGALGGLLPLLVGLLTINIASIIDNAQALTTGNYVGVAIRVVILALLGGLMAWLNSSVRQPLTLIQLGIAAPALITSYINGTSVAAPVPGPQAAIVSPVAASAAGGSIVVAGFLDDVLNGIGSNLGGVADLNRNAGLLEELQANPGMTISVRNTATGECFLVGPVDTTVIDQLRQSFPSPTYAMKSGAC